MTKLPTLENVEVVGLLILGVGAAYLAYKAYESADMLKKKAADAAQAIKDSIAKVNEAIRTPAREKLPAEGASAMQQSGAAAGDVPGPGQVVDALGNLITSWAVPVRDQTTQPNVTAIEGTGQRGDYFTGDQTQLPLDPTGSYAAGGGYLYK